MRSPRRRGVAVSGLAVLALCVFGIGPVSDSSGPQAGGAVGDDPTLSDEFVGPFASWTNVKTAYGASGDGAADDTTALQQGLSELGAESKSPVIFLPRGTYRITRTLTLAYTINVSIVGEDPATTRIVWDGEAGGTMLSVNGVAYSRFTRLTFDGQRRASVAVEQSWDNSRPHFDTGNEYADDRFLDVEYGIRGGFKGYGFAETSIIRAHFLRNTVAGVALGNFNALDIWIWHSRFDDCARGVTNGSGAGNFRVYSSVFRRSTVADLEMGNTGVFSARGNHSAGSRAFFVSAVAKASPAVIHLQGNTIVDPLGTTPIDLKNQGPGLLLDNVIRLEGPGPAIRWASLTGADVTSVGNTYTVAKLIENNGRLMTVNDRRVDAASLTIATPTLPGTPANHRRQVFEVASGAGARDIQRAIDQAARLHGKRAVVHVPYGVYSIHETLTIPASDVQIVGDGHRTILRWTGTSEGPLVRLAGPSRATIRELQFDGTQKVDGVVVENADQVGARVYLDQAQLRSGRRTDLLVNGLDHATVELRDFGHAYSPTATSVKVQGGPLLSDGKPAGGRTSIFSGAASGNVISYEVSGGATLLVRDLWYESGTGPGFARIHDSAVFTADGARVASPPNQMPAAFDIANLRGRAAIIATQLDDRIAVTGTGSRARVLVLAIFAQQGTSGYLVNNASPAAQAALVNSRHGVRSNRSIASPNTGEAPGAFVEAMLEHARREAPGALSPLPSGVTDVRMFRVSVTGGLNNVTLNP